MMREIFHRAVCAMAVLVAASAAWAQGPTPVFVDATSADNFKVLFITKTQTPPRIDGKLDDPCWKDAQVISDFGHCAYGARRCAFPKTEVRYLWDARYLYVGLTCYEDTPQNMARHNKAVEDKARAVYERDCVELHINGNNDSATRFQIWFLDTREKQIFWHYDFGWGILINENYGLSADWDYASSRGPDYWQIEGRIALADVQVQPRPGYIFGMNPCRFRFGMDGMRDDGTKFTNGDISQFLTWSTQGNDHQDARLFGKCILVEKKPASVAEGLRLAYPDLDKRKIMAQTESGFDIFDHGKESKLSYLDKLREELAVGQSMAKQAESALATPGPQDMNQRFAVAIKPHLEKLKVLSADIAGRTQVTVAQLNEQRKELSAIRAALEDEYWIIERTHLLAGEEGRATVDLKPIADAPAGRDEPENAPDPRRRPAADTPWARNFAGGRTRALIVSSEGASWGAYELEQRMDLDADVFVATGDLRQSIGPQTDYYREGILLFPQKKAQLQRLLAKTYDAYIFLDFSPRELPQDLQYAIATRMADGAAVVDFQSPGWDLGQPHGVKTVSDAALRETISWQAMTKLTTPTDWWIDHRGMAHDPLDREQAPLEVPAVLKTPVGKGRYVVFRSGGSGYWYTNPLAPHFQQDPDERFQAEYYASLDVKIILDAVGKLGPRRLSGVHCGASPIAPGAIASVMADTAGPAFDGAVRIVVRDQWGKSIRDRRRDLKLAGGKSQFQFPLPALPAGNYYVDCWLLQNDKVVDWASQRFAVQGEAKIKGIRFASRTLKETDSVRAAVSIDNAGPSATVRAEIRDVHGRVLQRAGGLKIQAGAVQIDLPVRGVWETYHHLDIFVDDHGVAQDFASRPFYVKHAPHDDFTVFTDGEGMGRYGSLRRQAMRSFGVNVFEDTNNPEDVLGDGCDLSARYWLSGSSNETGGSVASDVYHRDLAKTIRKFTETFATRGATFVSTGDDSGVSSDFDNNYPNWVMPLVKRFAEKYPPARRAGDGFPMPPATFFTERGLPNQGEYWRLLWNVTLPQIKSMKLHGGDLQLFIEAFREAYPTIAAFNRASGTSFTSFESITAEDIKKITPPFSPDELGFQDWLAKKYGEIGTLNKAWGAEEKTFETIVPATDVSRLLAEGKYAAALDKRAYLEDLFIGHMATAGRAAHGVDPDVGIGQGAASFDNVIPEVLDQTDTFAPYLSDVNIQIARSFPHRWVGQCLGVYGGKSVKAPVRRQQTWHVLFSGGNFIWFWSACCGGLMGDLSTNPNRSGAMLETIHEMKQGIASCLLRSQRQHDGIAILHSRAAGHMDGVVKEMSTQATSELALQRIIEDLGMQYRYVSTKQVESGVLRSGEFKTLVLPYSQILSSGEIAEIESFVRGGGAVIADLRAATFSTQGKPLIPGALDELFGVRRTGARAQVARGDLVITGLNEAACTLTGVQADASILAQSAKTYAKVGDVPAMLVNDHGKGKAILLNIGCGAYDFLLNRNELGASRDAFAHLFALAGVKSRFHVTAKGQSVPGVALAVFKRGGAQFLTVEKRPLQFEKYPLDAEIGLDGNYVVTDMRSGKSLGLVDRIPVNFEEISCHVWSLLPYKVNGLQVQAPQSVKAGTDLKISIALETSAPAAAHVLRVEAVSPSGAAPMEARLVDAVAGRAACTLPVAFNEETGAWHITVTDIASGVIRMIPVEITKE